MIPFCLETAVRHLDGLAVNRAVPHLTKSALRVSVGHAAALVTASEETLTNGA